VKLIPVLLALASVMVVAAAAPATGPVSFTDVTATAGIKFVHNSGRAGGKFLPETLGSGAAFLDANSDGWPDILLINSKDWKPGARRSLHALYRNNKNGTFTNVTAASGLDVEMYGMGVAVGDYDNDGRDDVYVTALEGDRLFRNEGNFKFRDVTSTSGIANANFGTSAAWLDYDKDGLIDLFVANYVQWTQKGDIYCTLDGSTKSYCTPESYKGTSSKLYRNLGGGKFQDVSQKAGIADPTSKSLGIAILDYDSDGWPDIFVANDTQPNKLYHNGRNGTFSEEGVAAGVAYSEDGVARGAMGADVGDYDRSGRPHLLVGNFSNQMLALSQRGHEAVRGRGADDHRRPHEPVVPRVRRLLHRLRPRRTSRHLRGERAHRGRDRPRAAEGAVQGAAADVQECGEGQVRARERLARSRLSGGAGGAWSGLRGLRQGRRPRSADREQSWAGPPAEERRWQSAPVDLREGGRHEIEQERAWGRRPGAERVGPAVGDGAERVELRVAERSCPDVRPGR